MTLLATSATVASLILVLALAWFLARPLPQEIAANLGQAVENLLIQHARHFPQLRHSLAGTDSPYVQLHASPQIEQRWRGDRQQVLQDFLFALGDDFARLGQLASLANAMLPKELAKQESIPLDLLLQFRANYRIASLLLRMRSPACTPRITKLAELLGNLSAHTEARVARLTSVPGPDSRTPLPQIPPD